MDCSGRSFFEDHAGLDNRTAWSLLSLARYLLEKLVRLDLDWEKYSHPLIEFFNWRFITIRNGVRFATSRRAMWTRGGDILSTYGAVLAKYA